LLCVLTLPLAVCLRVCLSLPFGVARSAHARPSPCG
jgi:hypothetical protein